jgi:Glycosyl transferases group 1
LDKHLHIVSLDVPFPADYGGIIDIFYKITALYHAGIKIHLHCFTKNRPAASELDKYCASVRYYQRKKESAVSLRIPFIVSSRKNKELLQNLQQDDYPVLLEGIHCSYFLYTGLLQNRKVALRLHNIESDYYKQLAAYEKNWLKKIYYLTESRLLRQYEKIIYTKAPVLAISNNDVKVCKQQSLAANVHFLQAFTAHTLAVGKEGKGCYCLYHGNLSVNENEAVAIWLLLHVFNGLDIPFVIAGKNPSKKLLALAYAHKQTCIIANPSEKEMQDMIYKAQVHVLPSFNHTGIKLKLLNALFNGRHCVVNTQGVEGSGLESVCHIANDEASFKKAILELYNQPFTEKEKQQRQGLLLSQYNNEENVKRLITFLW